MGLRIEDYALIGDTQTAALVGHQRLDRLVVRAPLRLGVDASARSSATSSHGRWQIAPAGGLQSTTRRYLDDTLVLETTFVTDDGTVTVTDCMPIRQRSVDIVRVVEGVSGRVPMRMDLTIRFDYGSIVPWVRHVDGDLRAVAGPDAVVLRTPVAHPRRRAWRRSPTSSSSRATSVPVRARLAPVERRSAAPARRASAP